MRLIKCLMLVMLASASPSLAQTANLVGGETSQYVDKNASTGSCYVGRGPSAFQRNAQAAKAYITLDELLQGGKYDLSGQATLTFGTATTGTISFKNAGGLAATVSKPVFNGYSQSYNAASRRLTVKFTIKFPGCNLQVQGIYDGA